MSGCGPAGDMLTLLYPSMYKECVFLHFAPQVPRRVGVGSAEKRGSVLALGWAWPCRINWGLYF